MIKKYKKLQKNNLEWILIFISITIFSFVLRYYLFDVRNSWHDEYHSIYVSDPSISYKETLARFWGDKGDHTLVEFYPPLYLFLLKMFFKAFGYIDDNGRIFSLIFGTFVVPLSMYLSIYFTKSKKTVIVIGIIVASNLFLIWQSLEIRAHMLVVFVNLINIILFFEILKSKKIIKVFIYYLISVFNLSLWPISGLIFVGKGIFLVKELIKNKKIYDFKFLIFFAILVTYIILNLDYLKFNLSRDFHYTNFSETFFYNYHFRSFYGSVIVGGAFLLIFGLFFLVKIKELILENIRENILLYIIISTYLLTIIYSYFRASIMSPKYVIFILPLIIIWIIIKISRTKLSNLLLIFLTLISIFNLKNINKYTIERPETKLALEKIVKVNNSNLIYTKENIVFQNYLETKKLFHENNLRLIQLDKIQVGEKFWFFCLNNPRFAHGNQKLEIHKKCLKLNDENNYEVINQFKFPDIILKNYIKKN